MSNLPISAFTAFIDIPEEDQVTEVEEYLKGKGLDIIVDEDGAEVIDRLHQICTKCCDLFSGQTASQQQELEGLVFSIASLFHIIEYDEAEEVLEELCVMITSGATSENAPNKMRLLGLVFNQFDVRNPIASIVTKHQIKLAAGTGEGPLLNVDVEKLKKWMNVWKLPEEDRLLILRNLWEAYKSSSKTSVMVDILTELLGQYSPSSSSSSSPEATLRPEESAELARKLLVLLVANPDRYIFEFAMSLGPVKALQGEKIFQLFQVFVNGKLSAFADFCESDRDFFDSLELDYNLCWQKMQVLTLVSLAANSQEVSFSTLCTELRLESEQLEQVILDAIRLKLLTARIDHVNRKILVRSCVQRTFGIDQWKQVHAHLLSWKQSIHTIRDNLDLLSLQLKQSIPQ